MAGEFVPFVCLNVHCCISFSFPVSQEERLYLSPLVFTLKLAFCILRATLLSESSGLPLKASGDNIQIGTFGRERLIDVNPRKHDFDCDGKADDTCTDTRKTCKLHAELILRHS